MDLELLPIQQQVSAEIDRKIATARAFPRSIKDFGTRLLTLSTANQQIAKSCMYSLPRRSRDGVKNLIGPSIRFAEIAAQSWGNLMIASRVTSVDSRPVKHQKYGWGSVRAEAACHDLEANVTFSSEYTLRIENDPAKGGVEQALNNAQSRAMRNAIFRAIPKGLYWEQFEASKKVAIGGEKGLVDRRDRAIKWLCEQGATVQEILDFAESESVEDLDSEQVFGICQMAQQIRDKEMTLDEALGRHREQPAQASAAADLGLVGSEPLPGEKVKFEPQVSPVVVESPAEIEAERKQWLDRVRAQLGKKKDAAAVLNKHGIDSLDSLDIPALQELLRKLAKEA